MLGGREVVVDGVGEGRQGPRGSDAGRRRLQGELREAPLVFGDDLGSRPGALPRLLLLLGDERRLRVRELPVLEHETANLFANITPNADELGWLCPGGGAQQHLCVRR
jgi:hypothetical protein